ncbi:two pore domain potassium channel family protein [Streptomyces venezuelae]|uniref:potassium channel family protein n=1 Tax=Streptomyces venezuelae TaxID=54571 RepID=UPI00123DE575|nr:potassium channel family protein [Streptomyces venezuelae]QES11531.1 two pore domain potassium channel family protein [Streptomyces venezuelae]
MNALREGEQGRRIGPRRVRLLLPLLRSAVVVTAATTAYFLLPLDRDFDQHTGTVLILGILGIGALLALQAVSIVGSPYPRLRAAEALSTAVPLFLLLFSATYYLYARGQGEHPFSEPLSRNDALYFTVTVFATVGFGDIVPVSQTARALTTGQMVADLVLVGVIAKAVVGAVRIGLERRQSSSAPEQPEP